VRSEITMRRVLTELPALFEVADGLRRAAGHFRIVHSMELKHTPYAAQIDALADLGSPPELCDDAWLVYDVTGVGAAVGAMVDVAWREGRLGRHCRPLGSSIVAGDGRPGDEQWLEEMRVFTAKPQTTGNHTDEKAVTITHDDNRSHHACGALPQLVL